MRACDVSVLKKGKERVRGGGMACSTKTSREVEAARMRAKTMHDLFENGVPLNRIHAAWTRASVRHERVRRSRGICRICGEKILKGEDVVISEEDELVILYSAFWGLSVRAHRRCYEELRRAGLSSGLKVSRGDL